MSSLPDEFRDIPIFRPQKWLGHDFNKKGKKLKKKLFNIYVLGGTGSGIYVVDVYRAIEMFSF